MSDQINEAISALLDDSANELDIRRVLKQAQQSDSVAATARRYQLQSTLMGRDEQNTMSDSLLGVDLSAGIAAAIEHEEFELEETASLPPLERPVIDAGATATGAVAANDQSWMKQLGGLAVAASVAAIVVVGSQVLDQAGPEPLATDLASAAASSAAAERNMAMQRSALVGAQRVSQGAEAQLASAERDARRQRMMREIEGYMQVHAQHASMNGSQGALSLARSAEYK